MITELRADLGGITHVRTLSGFNPTDREQVEKIFKVHLSEREWSITATHKEIEITFWEPPYIFGWLERITMEEFMNRLDANNLYLILK